MRRFVWLLVVGACLVRAAAAGPNYIELGRVSGSVFDGDIVPGGVVHLDLLVHYDESSPAGLWLYTNSFKVYSPDRAEWADVAASYLAAWPPFGIRSFDLAGANGMGFDTLKFMGEDSAGGFLTHFHDLAWRVSFSVPNDPSLYGKAICLDSLMPNDGSQWGGVGWSWYTLINEMTPDWYGPYCLTIRDGGCYGRVGDANGVGGEEPTLGDVSSMIDHLFISGSGIASYGEADIDGSGGAWPTVDDITIADVSLLIDYLFISGRSAGLPDCR